MIICDTHLFGVIQLVILFRLDHTLVFLRVNIYKKKKMQSIELANDCAVELTPVRAILLLPTLYLLVELLYVIGKTFFFFSLSLSHRNVQIQMYVIHKREKRVGGNLKRCYIYGVDSSYKIAGECGKR